MPFNAIDLPAFLPTLRYKEVANIKEMWDTLQSDKKIDCVTIEHHEPIPHDKIVNGVLEYKLTQNMDMIDNIRFNSTKKYKLEYEIGYTPHKHLDIYVCIGIYHELIIKVIFLEPIDAKDEFSIAFRKYYVTEELYEKLLYSNMLTKYKYYWRGQCLDIALLWGGSYNQNYY
jgi:hypothetical protein